MQSLHKNRLILLEQNRYTIQEKNYEHPKSVS